MADFKARKSGARNINQLLREEVLPHRSIEVIKGARSATTYKAKVLEYSRVPQEAELLPASSSITSPDIPSINSTPPETSGRGAISG